MTPTTEYALGFSAGSIACMFIFERVYRLVREAKPLKAQNGNGHCKSFPCEAPDVLSRLTEYHVENRGLMSESRLVMGDIRDGIKELVLLSREHNRRNGN